MGNGGNKVRQGGKKGSGALQKWQSESGLAVNQEEAAGGYGEVASSQAYRLGR